MYEKRAAKAAAKARKNIEKETEEQRNTRLKTISDNRVKRLSAESPEQSIKRKVIAAAKKRENILKE